MRNVTLDLSNDGIPFSQDLIPCLYTLFVSMGEEHLKVFTNVLPTEERDAFLKLLYVILQCSSAPGCYPKDEVYSIQTFNFWYLLQVVNVSSLVRNFFKIRILLQSFIPFI